MHEKGGADRTDKGHPSQKNIVTRNTNILNRRGINMKSMRVLCVAGAILLISQWSFTLHFSNATENEEDTLQHELSIENEQELILEEEAEPSDVILELDEQISKFEQERMLEEEPEPSVDEGLELEEQVDESEGELMLEEREAWPFDDNPPKEPDMMQEENTPVE